MPWKLRDHEHTEEKKTVKRKEKKKCQDHTVDSMGAPCGSVVRVLGAGTGAGARAELSG